MAADPCEAAFSTADPTGRGHTTEPDTTTPAEHRGSCKAPMPVVIQASGSSPCSTTHSHSCGPLPKQLGRERRPSGAVEWPALLHAPLCSGLDIQRDPLHPNALGA